MTCVLITEHGRYSTTVRQVRTGDFTIGLYRISNSRDPARMHVHPRASLSLILEGAGTTRFSQLEADLCSGTIEVEPAGVPHSHKLQSRELVWCTVEVERRRVESAPQLTRLLTSPSCFSDEAPVRVFRRIVHELGQDDPSREITLEGLALELLGSAIRGTQRADSRKPAWFDAAVELIESRATDRARLNELAREVGVHPVHLAREFRRHLGMPVGEFIRRRRIHLAARMLTETDYLVSVIAQRCGFSDQSHLTRVFVAHHGRTPGQYRAERDRQPGEYYGAIAPGISGALSACQRALRAN